MVTSLAPGRLSVLAAALLAFSTFHPLHAEGPPGTASSGNVDGVLTWRLGEIRPGETASRTALFLEARCLTDALKSIGAARQEAGAAGPIENVPARLEANSQPAEASENAALWIENDRTDFALEADGGFFWEGARRQSLRGAHGGQLSRLGYSLRYRAAGEDRRSGVRIASTPRRENLVVLRPVRRTSKNALLGLVASADGCVTVRIHARLGEGAAVLQRYEISNSGPERLEDVQLSIYSNLEAAHDHENDAAFLARETGVTAYDPRKKTMCLMLGLEAPASGWVGTWPSEDALVSGVGPDFHDWPPFPDLEDFKPALPSIATVHPGAPKVPEATEPETRALSAEDARAALERDWLFQAAGESLLERTRQEIDWARKLAARVRSAERSASLGAALDAPLAELEKAEQALKAARGSASAGQGHTGDPSREIYLAVRRAKRRILLANPAIDFDRIIFIDQPYPQGSEWPHQARHRNGFMAMPGGRLLVLSGLWPGGGIRKLADLPPGSYWKPDLSFEASSVAFCYKANDEEAFHLHEVGLDGSGWRKITEGPDDDLDPIYLPDGGFAFVTTRGKTYVRCMPYTRSNVLARCDADGSHIRFISVNSEPDWHPALLPDGRILFSRWEYQDKALWRIMSLWTVRPDGTQMEVFWGNQSVWPDHPTEARPIPGTPKVIFIGTAHHDYFAGSIGVIDPRLGLNYPHGLTRITWDVDWPECGKGPAEKLHDAAYHASGELTAYKSPFPLGEEDFLVSAKAGNGPWKIYLMDTSGNRELVYEGAFNCWYPIPVRPIERPPVLPGRATWADAARASETGGDAARAPGFFFSSDVLEGVDGVPRERVKRLRIIRSDYKTYTSWARDYRFEGPAVSIVQAESVKQILGTVPVEKDGSVYFQAPSGVPLHFQLLDEGNRALHTMRSFTGVMPGETRGCVGCHEGQNRTPPAGGGVAGSRPPSVITPPPWGNATIGYERLVQPVLDTHCGKCHQGEGAGRKALDLTLREGEGLFKEPYVTLIRSGIAGVIQVEGYDQRDPVAYATYPPLKSLSATSKLIEYASSGRHFEVKVPDGELQQLIGWVDAMGPYRGLEEIRSMDDPRCARAPVVARP